MGMQEDTAQKILSDPDFNPGGIWADALMEYMKDHPTKVADDAVAMKYLVQDPTVAPFLCRLIDINNIEQVNTCIKAISKCKSRHLIDPASRDFLEVLEEKTHDRQAIEDIIINNIIVFSSVKVLSDHDTHISDRIVEALIGSEYRPTTESHKAWGFLTKYPSGAFKFIERAKTKNGAWWMHAERSKMELYRQERKHGRRRNKDEWEMMKKAIPANAFQNFSTAVKTIESKANACRAAEIISITKTLWPNHYVCFRCGKGSGWDRYGRPNEKRQLKSKSGYSIHRKKCDPNNKFPSPHEIFLGEERDLEFACRMCGETFTSASGKTLHEKRCWIG
jgi:hypothetical protein